MVLLRKIGYNETCYQVFHSKRTLLNQRLSIHQEYDTCTIQIQQNLTVS